jgi:hypothetical protein
MLAAPKLLDFWERRALFGVESGSPDPRSMKFPWPHTGIGRLSFCEIHPEAQPRLMGLMRIEGAGHEIYQAYSNDAIRFRWPHDPAEGNANEPENPVRKNNPWGKAVGDPSIVKVLLANQETFLCFYEAESPRVVDRIIVVIGAMYTQDRGHSWKDLPSPVIEPEKIPTYGQTILGTSVPHAAIAPDKSALWLYWTSMYDPPTGSNQLGGHLAAGARIAAVDPSDESKLLPFDQGGTLAGFKTGKLRVELLSRPILDLSPFDWCARGTDISGNCVYEDGTAYMPFCGVSLRNEWVCGLARGTGYSFEAFPEPVFKTGLIGVGEGVQYPLLFNWEGDWYLYIVSQKAYDYDGGQRKELRFRLRLQ